MRKPQTVRSAETLGRVRLSRSFFMRDFLYSEIANIHGMTNLPDDPDLAIPWPLPPTLVSDRDRRAPSWRQLQDRLVDRSSSWR